MKIGGIYNSIFKMILKKRRKNTRTPLYQREE